ncbi:hypothetical protein Q8W71_14200 [Methylobacterium sp. NEAU 140]|uniref:hypothetical protein n=1 Tax=Methylobacterium sp. NEAU 140 TaxID=3064945 RepID=UPI002733D663|nr:hypothetical protein [Methylobacterium sp. NEAU 140]MDP4023782.1 hypothetical protein [Methylobacterium sp. NEAU 140]
MRPLLPTLVITGLLTGVAAAQSPQTVPNIQQPPIQSPQDAYCRQQAEAQVFSAPNPNKLSLYDLGSQIWHLCMASAYGRGPNPGRNDTKF